MCDGKIFFLYQTKIANRVSNLNVYLNVDEVTFSKLIFDKQLQEKLQLKVIKLQSTQSNQQFNTSIFPQT